MRIGLIYSVTLQGEGKMNYISSTFIIFTEIDKLEYFGIQQFNYTSLTPYSELLKIYKYKAN